MCVETRQRVGFLGEVVCEVSVNGRVVSFAFSVQAGDVMLERVVLSGW
jgi:hypothetical protein